MIYLITPPETLRNHKVQLPASKSISNRALLIRALAHSDVQFDNVSDCDDTNVMLAALKHNPETVDVGAAGTAMRFLTAYYAIQKGETHVLTGSARMLERPIAPLVDALRALGADITYLGKEGFPPLKIVGKRLYGGIVEMPGNISSQFISALLMIAPYMAQRPLEIILAGNIASLPYISMTMMLMSHFGAKVGWVDRNRLSCLIGDYMVTPYRIEPDWTAASYWFEIMGLWSEYGQTLSMVTLPGLSTKSIQGDLVTKDMFQKSLCLVNYDDQTGILEPTYSMTGTSLLRCDFTNNPDLAQTMVVTCCMMDIPFIFNGLESLYIKETNRVEALKNELQKLGYVLRDDGVGTMMWQRGKVRRKSKPVIETYKDHRMAMAFAPCCLKFGEIRIANPEVVSKSYPNFWDDLRMAGFNIQEIEN